MPVVDNVLLEFNDFIHAVNGIGVGFVVDKGQTVNLITSEGLELADF
jgi:hypothetical protein